MAPQRSPRRAGTAVAACCIPQRRTGETATGPGARLFVPFPYAMSICREVAVSYLHEDGAANLMFMRKGTAAPFKDGTDA